MKALTYNQYRITNIFLLTLIFVFIESAIAFGANLWFPELPYVLSLAVSFTALEMMRWNCFGAVAALASALAFCAASGATGQQYIIYCVGNLFMLLAVPFLKKVGKERVRTSPLWCICYAVLVFVLAQLGRSLVAIVCGFATPAIILQFITTDSLSCVFAVLLVLITRNADGLFEDQKSYLIRLEEERRDEEDNGGMLI